MFAMKWLVLASAAAVPTCREFDCDSDGRVQRLDAVGLSTTGNELDDTRRCCAGLKDLVGGTVSFELLRSAFCQNFGRNHQTSVRTLSEFIRNPEICGILNVTGFGEIWRKFHQIRWKTKRSLLKIVNF